MPKTGPMIPFPHPSPVWAGEIRCVCVVRKVTVVQGVTLGASVGPLPDNWDRGRWLNAQRREQSL